VVTTGPRQRGPPSPTSAAEPWSRSVAARCANSGAANKRPGERPAQKVHHPNHEIDHETNHGTGHERGPAITGPIDPFDRWGT